MNAKQRRSVRRVILGKGQHPRRTLLRAAMATRDRWQARWAQELGPPSGVSQEVWKLVSRDFQRELDRCHKMAQYALVYAASWQCIQDILATPSEDLASLGRMGRWPPLSPPEEVHGP